MLLTAVAVMATDYTDKLSVTNNISGNVPEDYAITKTLDAQTISVEEGTDGVYTSLSTFALIRTCLKFWYSRLP